MTYRSEAEAWLRANDPDYTNSSRAWKDAKSGLLELRDTDARLLEPERDGGSFWAGLGLDEKPTSRYRRAVPRERRESDSHDEYEALLRGDLEPSLNEVTEYLLGSGSGHVQVGSRSSRSGGRPRAQTGPVTISALRERLRREIRGQWSLDELAATLRPGPRNAASTMRWRELARVIATLDRKARHARTSAWSDECPRCGRLHVAGWACSNCRRGRPSPHPRTERGRMLKQADPQSVLSRASADTTRVEQLRREDCRAVPPGFGHVDRAACFGIGAARIMRYGLRPSAEALAIALGCSVDAIAELRAYSRSKPKQLVGEDAAANTPEAA